MTFTVAQRILALLLILVFTAVVFVGPRMLDTVTIDTSDLEIVIDRKDKEIVSLNEYVDELNLAIRQSQRACTNEILNREREILAMLDSLEHVYREIETHDHEYEYESVAFSMVMPEEDTILGDTFGEPVVMEMVVIAEEDKTDGFLNGLKNVQSKLKESIQSKKIDDNE